MNRWDQIQGTARDIASNVHADPALRDAMADDLIKLVGQMINATGKIVAGRGEGQMNDAADWTFSLDTESIEYSAAEEAEARAEFDAAQAREAAEGGTIYIAGERVQEAADEVVAESTNPDVNLERWRETDPGTPCRCGHTAKVHRPGRDCHGESFNGEACEGGPCNAYVAAEPTGGWVHVDRRPHALRDVATATPAATQDNHRCNECQRIERFGHWPTCSRNSNNATPAAADDAEVPQIGAVVYPGHHTPLLVSQGIVLDYLDGRHDRVIVWWTAKGAATGRTCSGELMSALQQTGTVLDLSPERQEELLRKIGAYTKAAHVRAMLDVEVKATSVAAAATCCHGSEPCPWSRVKAGGCCFPKAMVCPEHH